MSRPFVFQQQVSLTPACSDDRMADVERLKEALQLSPLYIPLSQMRVLRREIQKRGFNLNPVIGNLEDGYALIQANCCEHPLAVAIDIGTTNIAGSLWDLKESRKLAQHQILNPQHSIGTDILTRIQYYMLNPSSSLHALLVQGLNDLIGCLCRRCNIKESDIYACCIAGNTTMIHFLLDLDVSLLPVEPFTPVVQYPGIRQAREVGLRISPEGLVYIFPNAGSFVGGDIIAGILYTGIHRSEDVSVLVDVGTNAEVVIGTRQWLLVGAGAAGPALEEGILSCGMRADRGAIYRVEITDDTVHYRTIADVPARGICGSGVIDLVAELFRTERIDSFGRFTEKAETKEYNGERFFEVARVNGRRIGITEREIQNFLRSKAALYTTLRVLLESVGLEFSDIKRFYIAGALGSNVRLDKAQMLQMLPKLPADRFIATGNSSLKGAETVLKNCDCIKEVRRILDMITYKEMNMDKVFMMYFPSAIAIPSEG